MASTDDKGTGLGGADPTIATEFFTDLVNATTNLWSEQFARWADIYQEMRKGTYTSKQLQMDLVRMWDPWFGLAAFPTQWWANFSGQIPTLLLVVDADAQIAGPVDVQASISITEGVTPIVGPLQQIGGDATLDRKYIQVTFPEGTSRVSVGLVGLCDVNGERHPDVEPGFFVGPIYILDGATPRPLVLVYVLIEEQEEEPEPAEPES